MVLFFPFLIEGKMDKEDKQQHGGGQPNPLVNECKQRFMFLIRWKIKTKYVTSLCVLVG